MLDESVVLISAYLHKTLILDRNAPATLVNIYFVDFTKGLILKRSELLVQGTVIINFIRLLTERPTRLF